MNENLFLVIGSVIYEANLDGTRKRISSDFERASSMDRAGKSLMLLEGATLYKFDLDSQAHERLSSGWRDGDTVVGVGARTFVLEMGTLYEATADGDYSRKLGQMHGTTHLAGSKTRLFSVENGVIQELFYDEQTFRVVCEAPDVKCLAASEEHVYYISDDGELFEVEPASGAGRKISNGWEGASHMAYVSGKLVILDGVTLCHAKLDGSFDVISREWENVRLVSRR